MLFCEGDEHTSPSTLPAPLTVAPRLVADERRSRIASERSGRFVVKCCVSSMTGVVGEVSSPFTASVDEASNELRLDPARHKSRDLINESLSQSPVKQSHV